MSKVRPATPTVAFIDQYCAQYRSLFHNVRHFEQFTALHLGLLAETRHKSLPRLGKTVHVDPQALHHFLANADWSVEALRTKRLELLRQALGETPFILCLDETGDRKKGHTTDYVAHQYIGNLHTLANGVVSVNAYGVLGTTTFPLLFRVFKPRTRLQEGDVYQTKPHLAIAIVEELVALRLPLQRRVGRQPVRRERRVHQRAAPAGAALCGRAALQPRRLDAARATRAPDPLASLRARLRPTAAASSASCARPSSARANRSATTRSPPTRRPCRRRRPGTS